MELGSAIFPGVDVHSVDMSNIHPKHLVSSSKGPAGQSGQKYFPHSSHWTLRPTFSPSQFFQFFFPDENSLVLHFILFDTDGFDCGQTLSPFGQSILNKLYDVL